MIKRLDDILLSDNVVDAVYKEYENADFKNWLIDFLPEIVNCENCQQDNPWHIYNVLDHILHAVEEMNKMTKDFLKQERKLLAYTMFFHDIAKPICKFRRFAKSYQRYVDSFFNHANVGSKIVLRVIDRFKFTKEQQNIIYSLVKEHDKFINLTLSKEKSNQRLLTDKYVLEQIRDYDKQFANGKKYFYYLILVSMADNKAQNPELANERIELLLVMKEIYDKYI